MDDFDPLTLPYAPQRDRPLSLWNPLDYLLLLYWSFYFPQAIRWYIEKFGSLAPNTIGRVAIQNDFTQRRLAIQGSLLILIIPITVIMGLNRTGIEVSWNGMALGIVSSIAISAMISGMFGIAVGVAFGVAGGIAVSIASGVVLGRESGVVLGMAVGMVASVIVGVLVGVAGGLVIIVGVGIVGSIVFGIVFDTVTGVAFGIAFFVVSSRFDSWFIATLFGLIRHSPYPILAARSHWIPDLRKRKFVTEQLSIDWVSGIQISEGLSRYSLQFIPIIQSFEIFLFTLPPEQLLSHLVQWSKFNLHDWAVIRYQSSPLSKRVLHKSWGNFFVLPERPDLYSGILLRYDTPPRAAAAAFWLMHKGDLAEAATAFSHVRDLKYGEELYTHAEAMARARECTTIEKVSAWLPRLNSGDELLKPDVHHALDVLGRVASDSHIVATSRSPRQRSIALNRATGTLTDLRQQGPTFPTPERDNLTAIFQQWLDILLAHASDVGTLEVRDTVTSPYIVGAIVPANRLVGRDDLHRQLEGMWGRDGQRDSLVIYGHRRMGKSSLMRSLLSFCRLGEDTSLAVVNLQNVVWDEGLSDLCYTIAFRLWEGVTEALPEPVADDFVTRPLPTLRTWLAALHRAQPQHRFILVLDEYELIDKELPAAASAEMIRFLRGMTQDYPWLAVALVGLHDLKERGTNFADPLFQTWRPVRVGFMDEDATADALQIEDDAFPLDYSFESITLIHRLTGGQPYLVQLIGDRLVERFNRRLRQDLEPPDPTFREADIEAVISHAEFFEQGDAYFRGIWGQAAAPEGQHALLRVLAPHEQGISLEALRHAAALGTAPFDAALDALRRHDIVACDGERCRFTVELMRRWVLQLDTTK